MRHIAFSLLFLISLYATAQQIDNRARVIISTNKGDITVALYDETPLHRDNFIKLCKMHYFDHLIFHRVIKDFMIQSGDPNSRNATGKNDQLGNGGPGYEIPAEILYPKLFHRRGVLAAAREGDDVNPERKSSGSQFYIVWGKNFTKSELRKQEKLMQQKDPEFKIPNDVKKVYETCGGCPHLDGKYTVFGEVTSGLDIVDSIQKVPTGEFDRPLQDVVILSTRIVSEPLK